MNLQNTHFSYVLSPGAEQPYQPSDLGFRAVYYRWPEDQKLNVRNRYLNSVHNVDKLLEEFADFLEEKGLWDETLLVVLGDNGEAFYEHGFGNHSGPMYEEVVRTLAFIKLPSSSGMNLGDVDRPVSHIDIAATIVEAAGLARPSSFQGRSIPEADCSERPIFMYSDAIVRQFGIVSWPWKYLLTEHPAQKEELYNLADDPTEAYNVAGVNRQVLLRLRESLVDWQALQSKYYAESAYLERVPPDYCPRNAALDLNAQR
jgi:arylsulfatase A-like enzyme